MIHLQFPTYHELNTFLVSMFGGNFSPNDPLNSTRPAECVYGYFISQSTQSHKYRLYPVPSQDVPTYPSGVYLELDGEVGYGFVLSRGAKHSDALLAVIHSHQGYTTLDLLFNMASQAKKFIVRDFFVWLLNQPVTDQLYMQVISLLAHINEPYDIPLPPAIRCVLERTTQPHPEVMKIVVDEILRSIHDQFATANTAVFAPPHIIEFDSSEAEDWNYEPEIEYNGGLRPYKQICRSHIFDVQPIYMPPYNHLIAAYYASLNN